MTITHTEARQLVQKAFNGDLRAVARVLRGLVDGDFVTVDSVEVTATAAELNILDGVTALAREVNDLDMSAKFVLKDDFCGTWLITDAGPADLWSSTAGSGVTPVIATTVTDSLNGEVTLKSASDDGAHAANNATFTGVNLGWKANSGGLAVEARVQLDAITSVYLFVGFTDVISTTVECPIFMVAGDIDSDATDACGVIFDTDATTDGFTVGGVKAGTDTAPTISAVQPVAGTYAIIRVEVSAAGAVTGYIDGVSIGTVAAAVTETVALTPAIIIGNRSAAQRIATIDYIKVEQNRVD